MPPQTSRKTRQSEYGKRLAAKQAVRTEYGLRERQFRKYFELARKVPTATGTKFLELLERRLDNVIYRLDLSQTRAQARQWVSHGHVTVNGRKINIPSYQVRVGDVIELKTSNLVSRRGSEVPSWLAVNEKKTGGRVIALPSREDMSPEIDEQLIVEFYSR